MRRLIVRILSVAALVALSAAAAQACPMCNQSIAEEDHLPRAFMYSILFMLAMPATVFSGFGLTLYMKFRQQSAAQPAAEVPFEPAPAAGSPPQSELVASALEG